MDPLPTAARHVRTIRLPSSCIALCMLALEFCECFLMKHPSQTGAPKAQLLLFFFSESNPPGYYQLYPIIIINHGSLFGVLHFTYISPPQSSEQGWP